MSCCFDWTITNNNLTYIVFILHIFIHQITILVLQGKNARHCWHTRHAPQIIYPSNLWGLLNKFIELALIQKRK